TCAESLEEILAEPIMHLKQRLAKNRPPKGDLDALVDRICAAQSALG
ncbi:RNA-binding protein, partial [Rhizobium brockwellii]